MEVVAGQVAIVNVEDTAEVSVSILVLKAIGKRSVDNDLDNCSLPFERAYKIVYFRERERVVVFPAGV